MCIVGHYRAPGSWLSSLLRALAFFALDRRSCFALVGPPRQAYEIIAGFDQRCDILRAVAFCPIAKVVYRVRYCGDENESGLFLTYILDGWLVCFLSVLPGVQYPVFHLSGRS
jgi:hypothetical protein